ncbi:MFS transporter [Pantoea agglomerans]|uniref:MFS transporter n=1 Tax=Enterobacter agglomerans TaxID=549 RepID=UPI000B347A9A|nr:MFS transporter [Pantoea agglomerans]PHP91816.1 MFS transporter [Pantoea agglomerans]
MTLCVFALIASEFMPVSLLSPLSHDLAVSEGLVGQGIAISGALAVITSLSITRIAGNLDRKILLLALTLVMALSGLMVAMAPNYLTYMTGRALIGVVIGGFWSMSAAVAIRLVPTDKVPRALAIFNGGNALATVIAAPLGSYLGSVIGWRGAFFSLVPVALIALLWQAFTLPSMPVDSARQRSAKILQLLRAPLVTVGMAACGLLFMGQFTLFTYLRPFLETVTQVDVSALSLVLLTIGIAGFIGTLIIGAVLQRGFYLTLMIIPLIMALVAGLLIVFGHHLWLVAPLLGIWGLVATSAPTGWWAWIARTFPDNAETGGGLMVAIVQLSIALGSTLGGLAFDHAGWQTTFAISATLLVTAAGLAMITARKESAA